MAAVAQDVEPNSISVEERKTGRDETNNNSATTIMAMSRKEKRKMLKKMKRKQLRREKALKERKEEEARLNDHEEQMKLLRLEQEEAERMERDRREFEERERRFLQELELKKKRDEEEEQRRKLIEECQTKLGVNENANGLDEDDDWEYIEEGPAEIIWKGNEIIVKKKTVRVRKKSLDPQNIKQESDRPISNPLAPQSEAFEDYKSAREVLESVAQQVPNFGTEQDKAHCPFHLKTGVCRFGARCSRVHFYPDKSCTLLMKNMYSGPGLAWEHDEGLEVCY